MRPRRPPGYPFLGVDGDITDLILHERQQHQRRTQSAAVRPPRLISDGSHVQPATAVVTLSRPPPPSLRYRSTPRDNDLATGAPRRETAWSIVCNDDRDSLLFGTTSTTTSGGHLPVVVDGVPVVLSRAASITMPFRAKPTGVSLGGRRESLTLDSSRIKERLGLYPAASASARAVATGAPSAGSVMDSPVALEPQSKSKPPSRQGEGGCPSAVVDGARRHATMVVGTARRDPPLIFSETLRQRVLAHDDHNNAKQQQQQWRRRSTGFGDSSPVPVSSLSAEAYKVDQPSGGGGGGYPRGSGIATSYAVRRQVTDAPFDCRSNVQQQLPYPAWKERSLEVLRAADERRRSMSGHDAGGGGSPRGAPTFLAARGAAVQRLLNPSLCVTQHDNAGGAQLDLRIQLRSRSETPRIVMSDDGGVGRRVGSRPGRRVLDEPVSRSKSAEGGALEGGGKKHFQPTGSAQSMKNALQW